MSDDADDVETLLVDRLTPTSQLHLQAADNQGRVPLFDISALWSAGRFPVQWELGQPGDASIDLLPRIVSFDDAWSSTRRFDEPGPFLFLAYVQAIGWDSVIFVSGGAVHNWMFDGGGRSNPFKKSSMAYVRAARETRQGDVKRFQVAIAGSDPPASVRLTLLAHHHDPSDNRRGQKDRHLLPRRWLHCVGGDDAAATIGSHEIAAAVGTGASLQASAQAVTATGEVVPFPAGATTFAEQLRGRPQHLKYAVQLTQKSTQHLLLPAFARAYAVGLLTRPSFTKARSDVKAAVPPGYKVLVRSSVAAQVPAAPLILVPELRGRCDLALSRVVAWAFGTSEAGLNGFLSSFDLAIDDLPADAVMKWVVALCDQTAFFCLKPSGCRALLRELHFDLDLYEGSFVVTVTAEFVAWVLRKGVETLLRSDVALGSGGTLFLDTTASGGVASSGGAASAALPVRSDTDLPQDFDSGTPDK
jgi:hypothetical protein